MDAECVSGLAGASAAHGYELKQAFDETFRDVWPPINVGQTYTIQGWLDRDGFVLSAHVAQPHRSDKRVYELTADGQRELNEWIATPTPGPRLREECFLNLVRARTPGLTSASDPRVLIERRNALNATQHGRALASGHSRRRRRHAVRPRPVIVFAL